MRKIYIIGFRGTGFSAKQYQDEVALIRAGHVGFAFEGEEQTIYGFHPTGDAIDEVGGDDMAIDWLKSGNNLKGSVQIDTEIFKRAYELSQEAARTEVWEYVIEVTEQVFKEIKGKAKSWYTEQKLANYAFPKDDSTTHNCATFPTVIGIPVPEETGQLRTYIEALKSQKKLWKLKEA